MATFTSLNFAHELYSSNREDSYSGLVPHFYSKTPDVKKFKDVQVIFLRSKNWRTGKTYVVEFYAFPEVIRGQKTVVVDGMVVTLKTNVQSLVKNIHLLTHHVELNEYPDINKLLPEDEKLGKRGYNYLTKANVEKILDAMRENNPDDTKLQGIMLRLLRELAKA